MAAIKTSNTQIAHQVLGLRWTDLTIQSERPQREV